MGRLQLLDILNVYRELWLPDDDLDAPGYRGYDRREELAILDRFREFVATTPDCFSRSSLAGHVTGSALVVSRELDQVLLTLHSKLGLWIQLGGHADGNPRIHDVALREACEESGLTDLTFLGYEPALPREPRFHARLGGVPLPFDFDHHDIPGRSDAPEHVHYDVRFIIVADASEPLTITPESRDLRWFTLEEARALTAERSMQRQFDKLEWLRQRLRLTRMTMPGTTSAGAYQNQAGGRVFTIVESALGS